MAGTAEEEFEEISIHIRDSKSVFMLAMVNKIDQSTSQLPAVDHKRTGMYLYAHNLLTTPIFTLITILTPC